MTEENNSNYFLCAELDIFFLLTYDNVWNFKTFKTDFTDHWAKKQLWIFGLRPVDDWKHWRIKTATEQTICGEKTPTDTFLNGCLGFSFSPHHKIEERKKRLTRCTFYIENCYCSPSIIWPTIWEEDCAKERGREPTRDRGGEERERGRRGGWSLALRRGSVGKCRMDVSFSLWGELCIWLLFLSVFQGPDPRGPGQSDSSICVCMCEVVCVCVRCRERETDGGIYLSSFLQLQLSGLAVIHKATLHK